MVIILVALMLQSSHSENMVILLYIFTMVIESTLKHRLDLETVPLGQFCYSLDTTQSTSSERVKTYVNGKRVTAFNTAVYPSQNLDSSFNQNVPEHGELKVQIKDYI